MANLSVTNSVKLTLGFLIVPILLFCLLTQSMAFSEATNVAKKPTHIARCPAEYFDETETLAKLEVKNYQPGRPYYAHLVSFVDLVHQYKKDAPEICGYSSNDYLALLWFATLTLKDIRKVRGQFKPDTTVSAADSALNRLWFNGFEFGKNGFPRNPKQLSCLRRKSGVLETLDECEKLNPDFFKAIRLKILPKGWDKPA
jgi:hypothetical protein